eukprot:TRINITY_DN12101_c0_g2_i1.p1 TRINITY_DN12101_c0_g2~~TRINITY_DN12101_c0_g2_i1.p1  ORF type:complete len:206 (+),score=60.50 TRINITY_DN12101_c0_g2_i1:91-708(+)
MASSLLSADGAHDAATRSRDQTALLRKASEESRGELDGLRGTVGTLQAAVHGHAAALNHYKAQIRAVEDENRQLRQQLRRAIAAAEEAEARQAATEDEASQKDSERSRLLQRLAEAEGQASTSETECRQLRRKLDSFENNFAATQGRMRGAEADVADLRRRLILADAKRDSACGRAEVAESRFEEQEAELLALRKQCSALERQCL